MSTNNSTKTNYTRLKIEGPEWIELLHMAKEDAISNILYGSLNPARNNPYAD